MRKSISKSAFIGALAAFVVVLLSSGKLPSESPDKIAPPSKAQWVEAKMNALSLDEKIAQFFMVAGYSNRGEEHLLELDSLVSKHKVGGIIFFQGDRENISSAIKREQANAEIPLLIGMDAEWGVQMRLFGEERFPYNYTIGAANDPKLTERVSSMIGQECRELGIHINFAPVADVNSNPDNPVIGFRSYGENPNLVGKHVQATVRGLESQGVLSCIKHFPGHGDTDVDSHLDLPQINNTEAYIEAIDFAPFRAGIRSGASSVMIGHLDVPALDSTGTPSSLSQSVIQNYLKKGLRFNGLVISDALNMKAVSDQYGKSEVVVKAFEAGNDILLFPESVEEAIVAIRSKVESGEISMEELDARCRKVLEAKYKTIIAPKNFKKYDQYERQLAIRQVYEKALTVLKNEDLFPIEHFDQKIAVVSVGVGAYPLKQSMDLVAPVEHFHFYSVEEAERRLVNPSQYDLIIPVFHCSTVRARNNFGLSKNWKRWIKELPVNRKALVLMGNPLALKDFDTSLVDALVVGYESHRQANDRMGQFIMGTFESNGKLPITINSKFKREHGLKVQWGGRLKESQPEELGLSREKLKEIDRIAQHGINEEAYPGCQIVVAIEGKVILRKSYGHHTYDKKQAVKNTDIYDIASITKVVASTASLMRLQTLDKFSLNERLETYLPDLTAGTPYRNMKLRDMLAHQAGLVAWIPFYKRTMSAYKPSPVWYNSNGGEGYVPVANNLWMKSNYTDTMYQRILRTPLKSKRYKYSDCGYYFVRQIVYEQSGKTLDQFAMDEFYKPMGLRYTCYNPSDYFPLKQIAPTENDTIFRNQLVHGYVHDPGAAMIGGVGGHAGLFTNAGDLAALMQMFLNKGEYGGRRYIESVVLDEYTKCQYCPGNRRGAGFDKPMTNGKGGTAHKKASMASYGHSGFTGTLAWADPVHKVNYVFLSNRVYESAENWKIVKMSTRTEIQRVIYEALEQRK